MQVSVSRQRAMDVQAAANPYGSIHHGSGTSQADKPTYLVPLPDTNQQLRYVALAPIHAMRLQIAQSGIDAFQSLPPSTAQQKPPAWFPCCPLPYKQQEQTMQDRFLVRGHRPKFR